MQSPCYFSLFIPFTPSRPIDSLNFMFLSPNIRTTFTFLYTWQSQHFLGGCVTSGENLQIPLFASKIVHLGNHSQTQVYGVLAVSDFKEKHDLPWSWEKALSMRTEEWSHWIRPKISLDAYHVSQSNRSRPLGRNIRTEHL